MHAYYADGVAPAIGLCEAPSVALCTRRSHASGAGEDDGTDTQAISRLCLDESTGDVVLYSPGAVCFYRLPPQSQARSSSSPEGLSLGSASPPGSTAWWFGKPPTSVLSLPYGRMTPSTAMGEPRHAKRSLSPVIASPSQAEGSNTPSTCTYQLAAIAYQQHELNQLVVHQLSVYVCDAHCPEESPVVATSSATPLPHLVGSYRSTTQGLFSNDAGGAHILAMHWLPSSAHTRPWRGGESNSRAPSVSATEDDDVPLERGGQQMLLHTQSMVVLTPHAVELLTVEVVLRVADSGGGGGAGPANAHAGTQLQIVRGGVMLKHRYPTSIHGWAHDATQSLWWLVNRAKADILKPVRVVRTSPSPLRPERGGRELDALPSLELQACCRLRLTSLIPQRLLPDPTRHHAEDARCDGCPLSSAIGTLRLGEDGLLYHLHYDSEVGGCQVRLYSYNFDAPHDGSTHGARYTLLTIVDLSAAALRRTTPLDMDVLRAPVACREPRAVLQAADDLLLIHLIEAQLTAVVEVGNLHRRGMMSQTDVGLSNSNNNNSSFSSSAVMYGPSWLGIVSDRVAQRLAPDQFGAPTQLCEAASLEPSRRTCYHPQVQLPLLTTTLRSAAAPPTPGIHDRLVAIAQATMSSPYTSYALVMVKGSPLALGCARAATGGQGSWRLWLSMREVCLNPKAILAERSMSRRAVVANPASSVRVGWGSEEVEPEVAAFGFFVRRPQQRAQLISELLQHRIDDHLRRLRTGRTPTGVAMTAHLLEDLTWLLDEEWHAGGGAAAMEMRETDEPSSNTLQSSVENVMAAAVKEVRTGWGLNALPTPTVFNEGAAAPNQRLLLLQLLRVFGGDGEPRSPRAWTERLQLLLLEVMLLPMSVLHHFERPAQLTWVEDVRQCLESAICAPQGVVPLIRGSVEIARQLVNAYDAVLRSTGDDQCVVASSCCFLLHHSREMLAQGAASNVAAVKLLRCSPCSSGRLRSVREYVAMLHMWPIECFHRDPQTQQMVLSSLQRLLLPVKNTSSTTSTPPMSSECSSLIYDILRHWLHRVSGGEDVDGFMEGSMTMVRDVAELMEKFAEQHKLLGVS